MSTDSTPPGSTWWIVIRTPDGVHLGDTGVAERESDPAVWAKAQERVDKVRETYKVPDNWHESPDWDVSLQVGEPIKLRAGATVHDDWTVQ